MAKIQFTERSSFAQKQKTGNLLFYSTYPAERINGNTQESGYILQLHPVYQPGIASVKLFVTFLGRELKPFHKHMTEFLVHILVQDSSPVGYINIYVS